MSNNLYTNVYYDFASVSKIQEASDLLLVSSLDFQAILSLLKFLRVFKLIFENLCFILCIIIVESLYTLETLEKTFEMEREMWYFEERHEGIGEKTHISVFLIVHNYHNIVLYKWPVWILSFFLLSHHFQKKINALDL